MTITPSSIWKDIESIRQTAPLVHNITNYVVMNTTANALLALGASPVMAHAEEEVADMVNIASTLVINIGTLSDSWIKSMFKAVTRAKERNIPIVLDPVGAGATPFRTRTARELLGAASPAIIRGNGSEIMALDEQQVTTRGVDSSSASDMALESARNLSQKFRCTVCVTGEIDYIVSEKPMISIENGHAMMTRVTGLGCTATALCGAFAAVNGTPCLAAAHAMATMGIAGEIAARTAQGPARLQLEFIDTLYQLSLAQIQENFKA